MYNGYIVRFRGPQAKLAITQLLPDVPGLLFGQYYDIFTSSPGYAPNQPHDSSMVSFLVNDHTRYSLLAGLVGTTRFTPVAVLAKEYFREGVAPGGKFDYDRACATQLRADRCVEFSPRTPLLQQMHQAFWA